MPGLLGFNAGSAKEPELVEGGQHHVKIISAKYKVADTGRGMFTIALKSQDEPTAQAIFHRLFCGKDEDPQETLDMFDLAVQKFCKGFEVEYDVFENEDSLNTLVGSEANVMVKIEHNKDFDRNEAVIKNIEPL